MFLKTVIRRGEKIHNLESNLNLQKESNKELREENTSLKVALDNYRRERKEIFKRDSILIDILENFDYRKNNSLETIRKIKEVIIDGKSK